MNFDTTHIPSATVNMRVSWAVSIFMLLAKASAWTPASTSLTDGVAASSLQNQLAALSNGSLQALLEAQDVESTCTSSDIVKRRE